MIGFPADHEGGVLQPLKQLWVDIQIRVDLLWLLELEVREGKDRPDRTWNSCPHPVLHPTTPQLETLGQRFVLHVPRL
ncbi:hypothetical protein LINPERHAP1_LOCUS11510, partial [Linum perenne]